MAKHDHVKWHWSIKSAIWIRSTFNKNKKNKQQCFLPNFSATCLGLCFRAVLLLAVWPSLVCHRATWLKVAQSEWTPFCFSFLISVTVIHPFLVHQESGRGFSMFSLMFYFYLFERPRHKKRNIAHLLVYSLNPSNNSWGWTKLRPCTWISTQVSPQD